MHFVALLHTFKHNGGDSKSIDSECHAEYSLDTPSHLYHSLCAGIPKYTQFWRSCAAIICSQAALTTLHPPTQSLPAQTETLQQSLWYSALAATLASSLKRVDTVIAATQCALNASYAGVEFPALRAAFTEPLLHVCTTLNHLRSSGHEVNATMHAKLTAVCCACLLSAGRSADAVAAAHEWQKPPSHPSHAHVWEWLVEITRVSGAPVEDIMNKLGLYSCTTQAPYWVAHSTAAHASQDQQKSLDVACRHAFRRLSRSTI
jgi:hypothetical protein